MFHITVVFRFLLVLDRSFMVRELIDSVLVGALLLVIENGDPDAFLECQKTSRFSLRLVTFSRRRNSLISC